MNSNERRGFYGRDENEKKNHGSELKFHSVTLFKIL